MKFDTGGERESSSTKRMPQIKSRPFSRSQVGRELVVEAAL